MNKPIYGTDNCTLSDITDPNNCALCINTHKLSSGNCFPKTC